MVNKVMDKGLTEEQVISVLESKGYRFFEYGTFDKNLFLEIAHDLYEYNDKGLWYERADDETEEELVYLCNKCDEMYEDDLEVCERNYCDGSIREVHKTDMGL